MRKRKVGGNCCNGKMGIKKGKNRSKKQRHAKGKSEAGSMGSRKNEESRKRESAIEIE